MSLTDAGVGAILDGSLRRWPSRSKGPYIEGLAGQGCIMVGLTVSDIEGSQFGFDERRRAQMEPHPSYLGRLGDDGENLHSPDTPII